MKTSSQTPTDILKYWRAVELFSPQSVPRIAPNDFSEPVFALLPETVAPWEDEHPLKARRRPFKTSRRFTVYCGVFSLEQTRMILEDKLGKDPESFDERSDGESCLFAFSVTDDGRPLFDTFIVSSCAWATARTLNPGAISSDWLEGFENTSKKMADNFAQMYATDPADARGKDLESKGFDLGRPINYKDALQAATRIAHELGLTDLVKVLEIRVKAGLVASSKKYSVNDQDFLNSFFVKDLSRVATEVSKGNWGNGLKAFLAENTTSNVTEKIDIRKSPETLFQQLSPTLFPTGRWPSRGHHPLVFSQQFAINSIVQKLSADSGLFAVNGPPGTGKTTLLRDLIAAVVVKRAYHLAELARPEQAFSGEARWRTGKYNRVLSLWKPQFKGHEIVVASTNNGAVENVTLEIPGLDSIDPTWQSSTDYFPEFASRLIDQPAWAMIAARLGNKSNRSDFINRFWYGAKDEDEVSNDDVASAGFLSMLRSSDATPKDWRSAVTKFKTALDEENLLREERDDAYQSYLRRPNLSLELTALEESLGTLSARHIGMETALHDAQKLETKAAENLQKETHERLEHRRFRPGFLEILFSLGKAFRVWQQRDALHAHEGVALQKKLTEHQNAVVLEQQNLSELEHKQQHAKLSIKRSKDSLTAINAQLEKVQQQMGAHFPDPDAWKQSEETRERSSPWADPAWNKARAKVFLEALHLHKAFIAANADAMRKSLQAAMDVVAGTVPETVSQESVEAAWATLFFVIPVVSTTFASFDRVFAGMGRESLGWLLIDEAGQAIPQAATGAIWRSKRSVVVGDPLQLEPVVTIPFTVQQALRKHYDVEEKWLPGRTSVQQLADRASVYGTYVSGQDDPIWVGSPLRVHRRCDQLMFDISNRIAYDGMMVFGTQSTQLTDVPSSGWVDIESFDSEGHWIPDEGVAVEKLISKLLEKGVTADQIFLISPFRVVVKRLRQLAQRFGDIKVGTVHTVQGKESDIVILVLGGDPGRPGAKQWASARPNLLNVAVSRAKRRLFIIGNKTTWKQYRYFSVSAAALTTISISDW